MNSLTILENFLLGNKIDNNENIFADKEGFNKNNMISRDAIFKENVVDFLNKSKNLNQNNIINLNIVS